MKKSELSIGMNIYWRQHNGCGNYSDCYGRIQNFEPKSYVSVRVLSDNKKPGRVHKDLSITISTIIKEVVNLSEA
jgi:hypothetical protein